MRARQFIVENKDQKENTIKMFSDFFPLAMKILGLDKLPQIKFEPTLNTGNQPSFGMYVNGEHILYVALTGRHPNDILRTVAHELVHYKQDRLGRLNDMSGETGSPEENQANEVAGIIMRHFNKRYPQYLRSKPL